MRVAREKSVSPNIVLIGGHPKGYSEPFHEKTYSGKILRTIIAKSGTDPILCNLWRDASEERVGVLTSAARTMLEGYVQRGCVLIALGRHQERALRAGSFSCTYLPHPASRRGADRERLLRGLRGLAG